MSTPNHKKVSPDEVTPQVAHRLWKNMVPHHGITIISGIREDGNECLHSVYSDGTPPWVLIGMLETVKEDLQLMWQAMTFSDEDY